MSARNPAVSPIAVTHAAAAVEVAGVAVSFLNSSIHPVMDALVQLAEFDSPDSGLLRLRLDLVRHLAKVGRNLVEDAAGHLEGMESEVQSALAALKAGVA